MGVELGTAATQDSSAFATAAQGLEADSAVQSIVAGTGVTVDAADPQNPVVNATGVGGGTVTSVSVAAANGFLASVATPTTTPDITIKTGVTGILYGNGTGVSAAVAGNFPTLNQNTTGNAATATATASLGAVATIAALRLYSGTAFGQTVFMQGYTTQNDGGQGPFQWGAYATDNGGTIITPTGQVAGSWYRIFTGAPYVNFWGADPTGATASDTAFSNAIAYCKANSIGTLMIAAGTGYILDAEVVVNYPVRFMGEGYVADAATNNFAITAAATAITCASSHSATPGFSVASSNIGSGYELHNGAFLGFHLIGNYAGATPATIGIQLSGCRFWDIDMLVSYFAIVGVQIDCIGGTTPTDWNRIHRLIYRPGTNTGYPNTYTSNSLHLYQQGTSSAIGCSQNKVDFVMLWPDTGATGYAIVFGGDHNLADITYGPVHFINSGNNFGWDNKVNYAVGATGCAIVADTGTYGNVIAQCKTNGFSITLNGTAQLHYTTIDDVNYGRFYTPGYPMYDSLTLTPWQFYNVSGTITEIGTTIWRGLGLSDSNLVTCTIPAPFNWNNGNIIGINIFWAASAAATGTVVFNVNAFSDPPGTTITGGGTQGTTVGSTAYTAYESVITNIILATKTAHTLGNSLRINIGRGTDTYTGTVIVTGVQVVYQSTGPHSAGAGTFGYGGMGT